MGLMDLVEKVGDAVDNAVDSLLTDEQKAAMKEKAREECREEVEELCVKLAPWYVSCFFCCCGGPIGTMELCSCTLPEDDQKKVLKGIKKYRKLMRDDDDGEDSDKED